MLRHVLVTITTLVAVLSQTPWAPAAPADADEHVHISGFAFSPTPVTVTVGDTVTWDNHDSVQHSVVADDGTFFSDLLSNGATFAFTFSEAGTYTYACGPHSFMTGTVIVEDAPNAPPTVAVTSPLAGATVTGVIDVAGTAADADGAVTLVEVAVDGGEFAAATGTTQWTRALDTTTLTNGEHTLRARAYDGKDHSTVASVTVHVDNPVPPNEPPTVAVDAPAAGDVLRGVVHVTGTAADADGGVTLVEVAVDGGPYRAATGTDAWTFTLDTRDLANGPHTLTARAYDGEAHSEPAEVDFVVRNLPDLVLTGFTAQAALTSQTLVVTVRNDGEVPAPAFAIALTYELDGERHPIAEPAVAAGLAPGESRSMAVQWDTLGKVGRFHLHAHADAAGAVEEHEEGDNEAETDAVVLVDVPPMDLLDA